MYLVYLIYSRVGQTNKQLIIYLSRAVWHRQGLIATSTYYL